MRRASGAVRATVLLAAFLLAVSVSALQTRAGLAAIFGPEDLSGWDLVVGVLADPYLISFVAVPAFLVACAAKAPAAAGWDHLVRHTSRARCAMAFATERVLATVPFLVGWIAVAFVVASGFGFDDGWGGVVRSGGGELMPAGLVAPHLTPVAAVACQLVLMASAAWACAAALGVIAVWTQEARLLRGVCAVLGLWVLVSFKVTTAVPMALLPIGYLTVHHAVLDGAVPWSFAVGSVAVGAAFLVACRLAERRGRGVRWPRGLGLYALVGTVLLAGVELLRSGVTDDGAGGLLPVFAGVSPDRIEITALVLNLAMTAGAALTLHAGLVASVQGAPFDQLVRCRSAWQWWLRTHLRRAVVVAVAVPVVALVLHALAMGVLHGRWDPAGYAPGTLLFFVVATAAQILVYLLLMSALTFVSGRAGAGVWVLGAALAGALPALVRAGTLPVAQNSLSLVEGGMPVAGPLVVLGLWAAAAGATVAWALRRRGIDII